MTAKSFRAARRCAFAGMSTTATRMSDARCSGDTARYADLRSSMNDLRAALCIASGVPMEHIDRNGFNVSTAAAREYRAVQQREIEARRGGGR
jgi:hypothetical protein